MADTAATITPTLWETAFRDYQEKSAAHDAIRVPDQQAALATELRDDARTTLLKIPAPNLTAAIDKLMLMFPRLWDDELEHDAEAQRLLIGDLRRFERGLN